MQWIAYIELKLNHLPRNQDFQKQLGAGRIISVLIWAFNEIVISTMLGSMVWTIRILYIKYLLYYHIYIYLAICNIYLQCVMVVRWERLVREEKWFVMVCLCTFIPFIYSNGVSVNICFSCLKENLHHNQPTQHYKENQQGNHSYTDNNNYIYIHAVIKTYELINNI